MRLLVFQHVECEHPGSLRTYLREEKIEWDAVQLDQGGIIPPLEGYDALWVMGGPMDVWDVEQYPWLIDEKRAIRHWVKDIKKPYLGLCLGHQLLGDALGGTCGPAKPPEIGILEVELTSEGRSDPIMKGMDQTQSCLQWHSVEVSQEPENAVILASSNACRNQAMRVGDNAWSMQYHVEIEPDTITNWGAIPAYANALEASLGAGALEILNRDAANHMAEFSAGSRQLFNNFMTVCR